MASLVQCDYCGQLTEKIVIKLFMTPLEGGARWKAGSYSAHADIGVCCVEKIGKDVAWRQRKVRSVAV